VRTNGIVVIKHPYPSEKGSTMLTIDEAIKKLQYARLSWAATNCSSSASPGAKGRTWTWVP
jgi:hypothetical protein